MYILRDYQENSVIKGLDILRNKAPKRNLLVLPTGAGKSIVIAEIAKQLDEPIIILQPSKELLEQNYQKYIDVGGEATMYSASVGVKEISKVTFATIGSIKKEVQAFKDMGLTKIIIDEAHIGVKSGSQLRDFLKSTGIRNVLGLTATPFVLTSGMSGSELKMLTKVQYKLFSDISYVYQMKDMIENKYWTPLQYKVVKQDTSDLRVNTSGSDFTEDSLRDFYEDNEIGDQIVDYVDKCIQHGKKAILVFVPSIQEATALSAKISYASSVSSLTPKKERDEIISNFKSGKTKVVINVGILTTGFDYPELDAIILARSTMSFALYYQMVGRGVRLHPDKEKTLIIDLSENFNRFGRVETFSIDFVEDYGWGLFKGESLISNYPIEAKYRPTKTTLTSKSTATVNLKHTAGNGKLSFGKYKEKTLGYVLEKDKGYLVWLYENFNFNKSQQAFKLEIAILLNIC